MTVRHQEADAMTAAAGAEQRADLKFFAVIDDAVAQRLGYALDSLINVSPPARLSQSISNVAESKIYDVAASSRSNKPKCCLNRITAIVAFSAFNSVIWACLRYSSSLAFSTGRRTVLTLSSNAFRSTPVIRTNPLRPTVERLRPMPQSTNGRPLALSQSTIRRRAGPSSTETKTKSNSFRRATFSDVMRSGTGSIPACHWS